MTNDITIQSTGIYSSWCYNKPIRTLFDCGEGCASAFKNEIYGVERIFISHGHGDHILGLPSFVGIRNSVRGDKEKPLDVYYPSDCWGMEDTIDYILKRNRHLTYRLNFIKIDAGFTLDLTKDSYIKAFSMKHQKNALTLGYKVVQKRNRLKPDFVGKDISKLIHSGFPKDSLTESYEANDFAYCLDSSGFDYNEIRDCRLAVMDSTFLNVADRDDMTHFALSEVVSICKNANVKDVICAHISPRYKLSEIREAFSGLPSNFKFHTSKTNDC